MTAAALTLQNCRRWNDRTTHSRTLQSILQAQNTMHAVFITTVSVSMSHCYEFGALSAPILFALLCNHASNKKRHCQQKRTNAEMLICYHRSGSFGTEENPCTVLEGTGTSTKMLAQVRSVLLSAHLLTTADNAGRKGLFQWSV